MSDQASGTQSTIAASARSNMIGESLLVFKLPQGRTIRVFFHALFKNPFSLCCLPQQWYWSDFCAAQVHCFQTQHSQTQWHREESLSVKEMLMAPSVTVGVSDDLAQELQMPPSCNTQKGPGILDQIVLDQHKLANFLSHPWCKLCSKIDAVVRLTPAA